MTEIIRAVLDANVVASALVNPSGTPGRIVKRLLAESAFESVVSVATLAELRRCVAYPRLRAHILFTDGALARWIDHFAIVSSVVEDVPLAHAPVVRADPTDDLYLAVAVTGRAAYVVTGDHHLLALGAYQAIAVVPPRVFAKVLSA